MDQVDRVLPAALRRREHAAWIRAYEHHVTEIYAFIFHLVNGHRALAEDLHQETWLAAIDRIEQFSPERGELRDWLLAIARNKVALHFRRRASRPIVVSSDDRELRAIDGAQTNRPDNPLEQIEQQAVVRASLAALPGDAREALLAKYVEGCSVNEIAARTGRTPKAVESLLSRARASLRDNLRWYFQQSTDKETP